VAKFSSKFGDFLKKENIKTEYSFYIYIYHFGETSWQKKNAFPIIITYKTAGSFMKTVGSLKVLEITRTGSFPSTKCFLFILNKIK
jgi:hypothetical protein